MSPHTPSLSSGRLPLPNDRGAMSNRDVARYVSEMAAALAELSGSRGMPMLTYFLNMARVEADMQLLQTSPQDEELAPRRNLGVR